jgi:AraC-like DNA-binding protein
MRVFRERINHPHQAFRFQHFETDAFRTEPHRHDHLELTWIEAGEGVRFVGDSAAPFTAGDLVLIGANVPHGWISSPGRLTGPAAATVAQFLPELFLQPALPELARVAPLAERAAAGLQIQGVCQSLVTEILRKIRGSGAIARLAGLLEILELLVSHERSMKRIATSAMRSIDGRQEKPATDQRVDRIIGWIHRHMANDLRVGAAADIAKVTPAAFSRFFRREVGKTFTQYVNDVRCSEACIQLRRTDKAISVVAHRCGFETLSHFNRQFRRRTGMTPRAYRGGAAWARSDGPSRTRLAPK